MRVSPRPKVAHVTTISMSLRHLLLNQLKSIQAAGYDVTGISSPGPEVPIIEERGIQHIAVPISRRFAPLADLRSLWQLFRVMRREQFTIVHTHTPKPGLLGQLAARLARVPVVVNTLHGFYFHDNMHPLWRRFYIATEKIAALCSDVILSQNREDITTAVELGICPAAKIKYLGNGIDVREFDRARLGPEVVRRTRQALELSENDRVVGFVGRLVAEKGLLELLQAIPLVQAQVPNVRFLIIGPVDQEKDDALSPAVAAEYGVAAACIFTGMRHDMPELYALMDLFVLPSHREGFPRAPMEASAMGVPAIATDIRGCREAVIPGANGLLVPFGDVPALADAIIELLTNDDRRRELGRQARELAQEQFDEMIVFQRVKREYRRLLGEKGLLPAAAEAM